MPAKPYSSGHIGAVAGNFTDMRLSGDVKKTLVELSCDEISRIVPLMESETLAQDPERKTLDDPKRTRLNYNRTRELMIDQLGNIESVGSAAVQAGIEQVETHISTLIKHAEAAAEKDRVATIKPRHLEIAMSGLRIGKSDSDAPSRNCNVWVKNWQKRFRNCCSCSANRNRRVHYFSRRWHTHAFFFDVIGQNSCKNASYQ